MKQPVKKTITRLLLAIAFIGGTYYYYKHTPKETFTNSSQNQTSQSPSPIPTPDSNQIRNWKTLNNDKIGFLLQYPPERISPSVGTTEKLSLPGEEGDLYTLILKNFGINIYKLTNYNLKTQKPYQSINEYLEKDTTIYKNIILSGQEAKDSGFVSISPNRYSRKIFFIRNNHIWQLTGVLLSKDDLPIFNQILSTFQFTN